MSWCLTIISNKTCRSRYATNKPTNYALSKKNHTLQSVFYGIIILKSVTHVKYNYLKWRNIIMKILLYGIIGGLFSFITFMILQNIFKATDAQGHIFIGTIILSIIICACTGILVDVYKSTKRNL